jgi:hypothetical protein
VLTFQGRPEAGVGALPGWPGRAGLESADSQGTHVGGVGGFCVGRRVTVGMAFGRIWGEGALA